MGHMVPGGDVAGELAEEDVQQVLQTALGPVGAQELQKLGQEKQEQPGQGLQQGLLYGGGELEGAALAGGLAAELLDHSAQLLVVLLRGLFGVGFPVQQQIGQLLLGPLDKGVEILVQALFHQQLELLGDLVPLAGLSGGGLLALLAR